MKILSAYALAARLNAGRVDQAGHPMINHVSRVFARVLRAKGDRAQQIAALLYNAMSLGGISQEELLAARVPADAVGLIGVLTHRPEQTHMQYLDGIKRNQRALLLKMAVLEETLVTDQLALQQSRELFDATQRAEVAMEMMRA